MKPLKTTFYLLAIIGLLSTVPAFSQVGIGTTSPQGALDISATNGGLVIPRINLLNITDIITIKNPLGGGPVKGTIIYDLGTNITEGFYVFNGSQWQLLADTDTSLGDTDQTLAGSRTVNLNGFSLNFNVSNTGTDGLKLDTDYLELCRDAGNNGDGLVSTRGGMAFNIDSNNNNTNDNEYFSWGQDGAPGAGTGSGNYDELMRLDATGLGIGTNSPGMKLHVVETTSNINVAKFESPEFPMFAGFIIEDTGGSNTARFAITPGNIANNSGGALSGVPAGNANGKNSVTFDVEGSTYDIYTFMEGTIRPGFDNLTSLGAPNHRFTDIFLVNSPTVTSDVRLKENIVETSYGLDTVMQITPVAYELIDDPTNDVHLGFKAQQIQELIPEIVTTAPETGRLAMTYAEMIPVLTKAIQELNDKLDNVISENENLRERNATLLSSIENE
ncbi:MAG: tail fiber domain-containing protein [Bacteroidia bacterium]|nr:tail fiber domain-containing protein [Bacteroidia bacterium]NNM22657.1 hypothetical protein [Flavobacteriaceae bacterium]